MKELRKLLHTAYPDIFDYAHPKPLAIGIHKDIKVAFPQFSQVLIREFLKHWIKDPRYIAELLNSTQRHALTGEGTSIITENEKTRSHELLQFWNAKKEKALLRTTPTSHS